MTSFRKMLLGTAAVTLALGGSAIWWIHKRESFESTRSSDYIVKLRNRADHGDVVAELTLGQMYSQGQGVPQNYTAAAQWYQRAADQGNAEAQFDLGDLYLRGRGVLQSNVEAANWTRKAADVGYAKAQAGLGYLYASGLGLPQNYGEAIGWYRKAAVQGDLTAEHALGYMYVHGEGVPQDYSEAFRWIRKAAEQGDPNAESSIAYMYANGQGVAQDRQKALQWYRKAAAQGDSVAVHALQSMQNGASGIVTKRWVELFTAIVCFPVGFWVFFDSLLRKRRFHGWRHAAMLLLAMSLLVGACLSVYVYSHYEVCYSEKGQAFQIARFISTAIALVIFVVVILPAKETSRKQ